MIKANRMTTFNLFIKSNENLSEDEVVEFCKNYKANNTIIENILSELLNIQFYNKKTNDMLKYRPDFKL